MAGNRVEHLRSILEAHEFLPQRDHYLAPFERWLTRTTVLHRLHTLGIDVLAARNRALQDLGMEVPAPIVAKMVGYSDPIIAKHAEVAGVPMSRYAWDSQT